MKGRIPVLMYHEVVAEEHFNAVRRHTHADYILSVEAFRRQMEYLQAEGFVTLPARQVVLALREGLIGQLPEKAVVLTFDDGFAGNARHALPVLQTLGLHAAFFVTVSAIGQPEMMDWGELRQLAEAGMEIHSHLLHHVMLGELSRAESWQELSESRRLLAEKLGRPVDLLSLPNGSCNRDYPELAQEAGYLGGFSSRLGYLHRRSNALLLERVPVLRSTSPGRFARLAAADPVVLALPRLRRTAHHLLNQVAGESTVNRWYHRFHRIAAPHQE